MGAGHLAPVLARERTVTRPAGELGSETSGSTLRRRLAARATIDLLPQVHTVPVAMPPGHPDLILKGCSVCAKRGSDLTGLVWGFACQALMAAAPPVRLLGSMRPVGGRG